MLTVPASLAGLPALSVPVPAACRRVLGEQINDPRSDDDGWPVGISKCCGPMGMRRTGIESWRDS